jgi:hypothetical protein
MTRRDVIRSWASRVVIALAMPLLLVAAPAVGQSPSVPAASIMPAASATPPGAPGAPTKPAFDPDSPTGRLLGLRDALAADRALLVELRKDVPATRDEAIDYVERVATLALTSDPAGLGVIVSRVREAAPVWLDWREGQYATTQEAADAYARTGAAAFDVSWENLHDAVLLTVVNRLDTIIDLADRIEAGQ